MGGLAGCEGSTGSQTQATSSLDHPLALLLRVRQEAEGADGHAKLHEPKRDGWRTDGRCKLFARGVRESGTTVRLHAAVESCGDAECHKVATPQRNYERAQLVFIRLVDQGSEEQPPAMAAWMWQDTQQM